MKKVKSHATVGQVLAMQNTTDMLALDELAGVAAGVFAYRQGDRNQLTDK